MTPRAYRLLRALVRAGADSGSVVCRPAGVDRYRVRTPDRRHELAFSAKALDELIAHDPPLAGRLSDPGNPGGRIIVTHAGNVASGLMRPAAFPGARR